MSLERSVGGTMKPSRRTDGTRAGERASARRTASESEGPDERLFIASLEKGLKVLETFADMTSELGLQEIAAATGLGKSAVQRLVYTLLHLGYLRRYPATRKYRLSSKVFLRGYTLARASDLVQEAHSQLVRVNHECGDTCVLAMMEGGEIVILSSVQGRHIDSLNVAVGMRFPVDSASSGLVLLAWLPLEEAKLALQESSDAAGQNTSTSRLEVLAEAFSAVRTHGYCMTENAIAAGHLSVSAPVFDAAGHAVAALNVSTFTERYADQKARQALIAMVLGAAEAVSARLGYSAS